MGLRADLYVRTNDLKKPYPGKALFVTVAGIRVLSTSEDKEEWL